MEFFSDNQFKRENIKETYSFELSQSGLAENAIATHKQSGKKFFLKVIITKFMQEKEISDLFERTLIISQLSHPSIANLYEVYEDPENGLLYLVYEYLMGKSLSERIQEQIEEGNPFDEKTAGRILYEIVRGVNHLHSQNLVHSAISVRLLMTASRKA
jgi:serine/threonine protein kinase